MRKRLLGAIAAGLISTAALACGSDPTPGVSTATPFTPATTAPLATIAAPLLTEPRGDLRAGRCVPAAPIGVSVGDAWTISGAVEITGPVPGDLPPGLSVQATTFEVAEIADWVEWVHDGDEIRAEDSKITINTVNTLYGDDGGELSAEQSTNVGLAVSANFLSPALTLDWECHARSWLESWEAEEGIPFVEQLEISGGPTVIVFGVEQAVQVPGLPTPQTVQRSHGYEMETGRLVLREVRASWQSHSVPNRFAVRQELQPGDTHIVPAWLEELIRAYEQAPVYNPPRKILSYRYLGETVYYVPAACCDMFSELLDSEGVLMGHPDGGITGAGDGQFSLFSSVRTDETLVWEDTRE